MHRTLSLLTVSIALAACGQSEPPRLAKHGPAPGTPAGEVSGSVRGEGLAKLRAVRQAGDAKGLIRWQEKDVRVTAADATEPAREPALAIDPTDSRNVLAGVMDFGWASDPRSWEAYPDNNRRFFSRDGGATWKDTGFEPIPALTEGRGAGAGDPAFAFDAGGVAHFISLASVMDPPRDIRLQVSTSRDAGESWSTPVPAVGWTAEPDGTYVYPDKEFIAADPTRPGHLYVAWSMITSSPGPAGSDADAAAQGATKHTRLDLHFTASEDGGRTWRAPLRIADPTETYGLGAYPFVTLDGAVHVAWFGTRPLDGEFSCPSVLGAFTSRRPSAGAMVIASSRDVGRTWTQHAMPVCEGYRFPTPARPHLPGSEPAVSVDRQTGRAIVAWVARESPEAEDRVIRSVTSDDDGRTWSAPQTIVAEPGADLLMPSVSAEGGRAVLMYVSAQPGGAFAPMVRTSEDGGRSWSEAERLSSEASPAGPPDAPPEIGDYNWIELRNGRVAAMWTDYRDGQTTRIWSRAGVIGALRPKTTLELASRRVKKRRVRLTVTGEVVQDVTVRAGRARATVARLLPGEHRVRLPGLRRGRHVLTASGTDVDGGRVRLRARVTAR